MRTQCRNTTPPLTCAFEFFSMQSAVQKFNFTLVSPGTITAFVQRPQKAWRHHCSDTLGSLEQSKSDHYSLFYPAPSWM